MYLTLLEDGLGLKGQTCYFRRLIDGLIQQALENADCNKSFAAAF